MFPSLAPTASVSNVHRPISVPASAITHRDDEFLSSTLRLVMTYVETAPFIRRAEGLGTRQMDAKLSLGGHPIKDLPPELLALTFAFGAVYDPRRFPTTVSQGLLRHNTFKSTANIKKSARHGDVSP